MIRIFRFLNLVFIFCLVSALCWAQDIGFQATVDSNRITMDSVIRLSLTITNAQPSSLQLPDIDGFESRYVGPATQVSIVNGQVSKSITYNYSLFPTKTGTFTIPAFSIEVDGKTVISNPISIEVMDASMLDKKEGDAQAGVSERLEDKIFLTLGTTRDDVYLGEKVSFILRLFVRGVSLRDIQFPELDRANFIFDEYRQPDQYQKVIDGLSYDVVEFKIDGYPTRAGEVSVGQAQLKANVLYKARSQRPSSFDGFFGDSGLFDSFFDHHEKRPISVRSQELTLSVLPLPEEGKPLDFSGAVGRFDLQMTASPLQVKVGDPITIVMKLSGQGDLKTAQLPAFVDSREFKAYDPQIKEVEGVKILEQVLIPRSENVVEVPKVSFSYFDVLAKKYQTIWRGPFSLKVEAPADKEGFKAVEPATLSLTPFVAQEEKLGRDIVFIKEHLGKLHLNTSRFYQSWTLKWGYVLLTLFFFIFYIYWIIACRLKEDVTLARKWAAPKKAKQGMRMMKKLIEERKVKEYYDLLSKTLQEYFKDKFHLSSAIITFAIVKEVLHNKKVPYQVVENIQKLFDECDEARFASIEHDADRIKVSFHMCEEVIDHCERNIK